MDGAPPVRSTPRRPSPWSLARRPGVAHGISWGVLAVALAGAFVLLRGAEPVREAVVSWYGWLSGLYAVAGVPLHDLAGATGLPGLPAVVLGLAGALSPCQLSTSAGAIAYASRASDSGPPSAGALWLRVGAFTLAKLLIYSGLGGAVVAVGLRAGDSVPVVQAVRLALGPVMLVLGLHLLGVLPARFSLGAGLSRRMARAAGNGMVGAFLLGTAFSLAFCPTLFLLFFGLLLPLALTQPLAPLYPGLFALGTMVPLFGLTAFVTLGLGSAGTGVRRSRALQRVLNMAAAVVLLVAGLNDTVVYWLV